MMVFAYILILKKCKDNKVDSVVFYYHDMSEFQIEKVHLPLFWTSYRDCATLMTTINLLNALDK